MHSDELQAAKARLQRYLDAEEEVLIKGQQVKGEEDTALTRASLAQIRQAITSIKDEIRELESRASGQPDDGYELNRLSL